MSSAETIDSFLRKTLGSRQSDMDAVQLKGWINEYLQMRESDPRDRGSKDPHWNLWMRDHLEGEAPFIAVSFFADHIELMAGLGDCYGLRSLSENPPSPKPERCFQALRRKFNIAEEPLRVEQTEAERWLKEGSAYGT